MIEVLNFFPIKDPFNKDVIGTLKIRFPEWGVVFMGILVIKKDDRLIFMLPVKTAIDRETGKKTHYPLIAIENEKKRKKIRQAITEKGLEFIKNFPEGKKKEPEIIEIPGKARKTSKFATSKTTSKLS